ncbi:LysR family transcriptional regulator [Shewanella oneidensis MR-1]|uniref:Transcriptional regulator LysR family n=1 Tax=Shewanella oneidensis (strain ATCC 700550 / JCM 31522 / CIP 106686 / LMG 19005 / NCIMB 14063 / MR-1) TaxID=211586 RepID=Q8EAM4_SHEON|nr:LysR family transcriptional regulator [Shewanella oneidensis]AAN56850.1 transcriptional regulator LysR family [Shewanella oneidensis MR-1]MDX5998786.1 LysR family transcriptional regulator [Shewanella oneidensis]MEE2029829.1 HTH-type transcriptional regulator YidZ [Shewanella oneidensis]QKG98175.1 LysR family transcriptional regulator [Shewanella oneidensis MR-1]
MIINNNIKELSIAHLQLIVCLIKHGNSCVVSDELGISQSSISYHLRRLRVIFADEMFIRTGKGLKPTERCIQIGHFAQDLINRVEEELIHANDFVPKQMKRELTLIAADTACGWFSTLFSDMQKTLPRVTLCARPWNLKSMEDLDSGAVDFGIHIIENSKKGIYDMDIAPCYRLCVVRDGHPLISKGEVTLKDLEQYPVLINDLGGWNNDGNSLMQRVLEKHGLKLNIAGRLGYINSIFTALHTSNAITYTSAASIPQSIPGLTLLRGPKEVNEVDCFYRLYISRMRYGSQETNYLIDFIYDSFKHFLTQQYNRIDIAAVINK